jgi:hypothetical protein
MVFGPGNPETAGQRPSRVCFCSLRNHTSVVLYLSHATKTTEKQLLILEFHMPSSPWRRDDVTPTEPRHDINLSNNTHDVVEIPRWHWCNRGNPYTTCCILIFLYHPGYHGSIDQILFVFYEIYHVCDNAHSRINFVRKGILVCVC